MAEAGIVPKGATRVRVWPVDALAERPAVWAPHRIDDRGSVTIAEADDLDIVDATPLPPEYVLRELLELDLEDRTVLTEQLQYGLLTDTFVSAVPQGTVRAYRNKPSKPAPKADFHLDDVAAYLHAARAMSNTWLETNHDPTLELGVADAWRAEGFTVHSPADEKPPNTQAQRLFVETLNHGLLGQAPNCTIVYPDRKPLTTKSSGVRPLRQTERSIVIGASRVDLFTAVSTQIFNLLAEDLPTKQCENETCQRWFVRQRTTGTRTRSSKRAQKVVGVFYCSTNCSRAQASRAYARKKQEEKRRQEGRGRGLHPEA